MAGYHPRLVRGEWLAEEVAEVGGGATQKGPTCGFI